MEIDGWFGDSVTATQTRSGEEAEESPSSRLGAVGSGARRLFQASAAAIAARSLFVVGAHQRRVSPWHMWFNTAAPAGWFGGEPL
jgi:hypothetical protein